MTPCTERRAYSKQHSIRMVHAFLCIAECKEMKRNETLRSGHFGDLLSVFQKAQNKNGTKLASCVYCAVSVNGPDELHKHSRVE